MSLATTSSVMSTDQGIAIVGELVFASVSALSVQGSTLLEQTLSSKQDDIIVIDCTAMQRIDSAGIALLLQWQRHCSNKDKACRFSGLSKQAESLIHAYRLQFLVAA